MGSTLLRFKPPTRHERQTPKVLPLPIMLVQRFLIEASSCKLSVPRRNGVSVAAGGWIVVPKATMPGANGNPGVLTSAAELVQLVPVNSAPAPVASNLITTELGLTPVSVLLIKSSVTDRDANAFGVSKHEQQEMSCSSGENA